MTSNEAQDSKATVRKKKEVPPPRSKVWATIYKFSFPIALAISYASILLAFTTVWQLVIVVPVVAGFFVRRQARIAWWAGFSGALLAWLSLIGYFLATQPALAIADFLMEIITGASGLGAVAVLLTLIIGGSIGGLGGIIGFYTSTLLLPGKRSLLDPGT